MRTVCEAVKMKRQTMIRLCAWKDRIGVNINCVNKTAKFWGARRPDLKMEQNLRKPIENNEFNKRDTMTFWKYS